MLGRKHIVFPAGVNKERGNNMVAKRVKTIAAQHRALSKTLETIMRFFEKRTLDDIKKELSQEIKFFKNRTVLVPIQIPTPIIIKETRHHLTWPEREARTRARFTVIAQLISEAKSFTELKSEIYLNRDIPDALRTILKDTYLGIVLPGSETTTPEHDYACKDSGGAASDMDEEVRTFSRS